MSAITLTDTITGQSTGQIDTDDIVDALTPWYPDAPAEITDAIAELQRLMRAGDWAGANEYVVYLGLEASRPSRVDMLVLVEQAAADLEQAQTALDAAADARDDAVRAAFLERVPGPAIATAAGVSVQRAYQIRDGKR